MARRWNEWIETRKVDGHEVYFVRDDAGRTGVLKALPARASRRSKKRFANEALNAQRLDHRGVVRVIDRDPRTAPQWFVMEPGVPVVEHLGPEPDLWAVVELVSALAATLRDLAEVGIHHRDIKPDNIVVRDGVPQLTDFEFATWVDREPLTRPGDKVGAAYFLAPEMRRHASTTSAAFADVYSLAKTLFVLATPAAGPYPPDGEHRRRDPTFSLYWQGGPAADDLEFVLANATRVDPRERLTMRQFQEELTRWVELHPRADAQLPEGAEFRRLTDPRVRARLVRDGERYEYALGALQRACNTVGRIVPGMFFKSGSMSDLLDTGVLPDQEPETAETFVSTIDQYERRVVMAYVVHGEGATFVGEVQRGAEVVASRTSEQVFLGTPLHVAEEAARVGEELAADFEQVPQLTRFASDDTDGFAVTVWCQQCEGRPPIATPTDVGTSRVWRCPYGHEHYELALGDPLLGSFNDAVAEAAATFAPYVADDGRPTIVVGGSGAWTPNRHENFARVVYFIRDSDEWNRVYQVAHEACHRVTLRPEHPAWLQELLAVRFGLDYMESRGLTERLAAERDRLATAAEGMTVEAMYRYDNLEMLDALYGRVFLVGEELDAAIGRENVAALAGVTSKGDGWRTEWLDNLEPTARAHAARILGVARPSQETH